MNQLFTDFNVQKTGENSYSAQFKLNPEHIVFQAHFPGQTILPGITMMRVIRDIAASILDLNLTLKTVKNVKFTNVVTPTAALEMEANLTITADLNHYTVSGTLHHNNAIAAKLDELVYA